ncbi:hypothetical protein C8Q70DRAFT_383012 [Cubamyces menziesii]|nr:hypothetical protein C8Q70DRAFT_383012 [Cubamyces menziesii]
MIVLSNVRLADAPRRLLLPCSPRPCPLVVFVLVSFMCVSTMTFLFLFAFLCHTSLHLHLHLHLRVHTAGASTSAVLPANDSSAPSPRLPEPSFFKFLPSSCFFLPFFPPSSDSHLGRILVLIGRAAYQRPSVRLSYYAFSYTVHALSGREQSGAFGWTAGVEGIGRWALGVGAVQPVRWAVSEAGREGQSRLGSRETRSSRWGIGGPGGRTPHRYSRLAVCGGCGRAWRGERATSTHAMATVDADLISLQLAFSGPRWPLRPPVLDL